MQTHYWKIEWNDRMSVGIPEVDADHKRFIILVNELNRAIVDRMDAGEIRNRLQLILEDAKEHFAHEETLFGQWNYPDTENHAAIHGEILGTLGEIMAKSGSFDLEREWIEAGLAIKDTLINHILAEDMKYADFYRKSHGARDKHHRH
jgi:hemerythrin